MPKPATQENYDKLVKFVQDLIQESFLTRKEQPSWSDSMDWGNSDDSERLGYDIRASEDTLSADALLREIGER